MIEKPFQQILDSLASKTPTPGGGAAAALTAAMGTALCLMVVRFSRGKKANVDREPDLAEAETALAALLVRAQPLAARDCASFDRVSAAYALPKESEEDKSLRLRAIEETLLGASVVPDETLHLIRDVLEATLKVHACVGKNIASDLGSASELLRASAEAALLNVRVNVGLLADRGRAQSTLARAQRIRAEVQKSYEALRAAVEKQMG